LIVFPASKKYLLAGTFYTKLEDVKFEKMIEEAFFFRVLENGTNDNLNILDYCKGINRAE